ncbi:J domain-containing protein [Sphingomonas sp. UYP23]
MTQAYPLQWPTGWPRAQARASAPFKQRGSDGWMKSATIATARERLQRELDLLRVSLVTLSTNVELRLDGQPRSDRGDPSDPGVAVYFTLKGKQTVLACDRWTRVADNIVALAKHIEALRGMDRWGVGTAEQAFAGYQALPAPIAQRHWTAVLALHTDASIEEINAEYRHRAKAAVGDDRKLLDLNLARDAAIAARTLS